MNTAAPSAFPVDVHRQPSRDCRRFVALACIKIHPGTSSYVVLPIKGFSWRVWDFGLDYHSAKCQPLHVEESCTGNIWKLQTSRARHYLNIT